MTFKHCFYEWLVLRSFLVISGFVIKKKPIYFSQLISSSWQSNFGKAKINGISVFEKVLCSISHEFSLLPFFLTFFPNYRYQWTFKFSFPYFARQRLFLRFSFRILRGKLTHGRPGLMPFRMLEFDNCVVNNLLVRRAHFSRILL